MEHDANSIIDLLTTTGSKFNGITAKLENCDSSTISQWVADALDLIYEGNGPPDANMIDNGFIKTLGASDEACMVTAVIAQWILRFTCKKLMQLMTPESAILNRKYGILLTYIYIIINV